MASEAFSPAACAAAHRDVVTKSHLLSWVGTIAAFVVALAVAWGALQVRVTYLEAETERQARLIAAQSDYVARMDNRLVELRNDMGWQIEMTRLIAQKLDVSVPARGK
jgi:hypothetical protein